jgi:hypothetical protein
MNSTPKNTSKNIIITYARAIRDIQNKQIDPYMELIEKELIKIWPDLEGQEDGAANWACDISSATSNEEVASILNRLNTIIENRRIEDSELRSKWMCRYCGKDTSEVEYDYLSGTDHLGCVLENSQFDVSKHVEPLENRDQVLSELKALHVRLLTLESAIKSLY